MNIKSQLKQYVSVISHDRRALLLDLTERMAVVGAGKRVRVEAPEGLPEVLADADRLERILANLLTNALKYSAPDTPVTVAVTQRNGGAVIAVADRGRGIAPHELPHLSERFYRTSGARARRDGLGLGLYITKGLVEAHGGRIWVDSTVGEETTFYFSLPAA